MDFRFVRINGSVEKSLYYSRTRVSCINALAHSMPWASMCTRRRKKCEARRHGHCMVRVIQHKLVVMSCAGDALVAEQHQEEKE